MNAVKQYFSGMSPLAISIALAMSALAIVLWSLGHHDAAFVTANAGAVDLEALAKEFKDQATKFGTARDELKLMGDELKAKTEGNDATLKQIKGQVDEFLSKFNGMKESMAELEQKMAQGAKDQRNAISTWGEQFVAGASYKSAAEQGNISARRGTMSCEVKQVNSTAAGGLIRSMRENDVISLVRERRVVRDLLRVIQVNTSSVDYAVQTARTNAAAPVAEGTTKPYSDYTWGSNTVVVRTLAHLAKLTRQAMDDAPRLVGEIDAEMRYGLGFVEERQFLYGSGVGQNLAGIIPQATAFARPAGAGQQTNMTKVDILRFAILQASLALLPADGIVLNPLDWGLIELTKTTDGAYLFANPQGTVSDRMWNLPVVSTPAMDAGDFLVGSFQMGAVVYDRMGVEVLISTENADDFEKNLATMRAEERVAIAVKRPGAFVTGDFTTAEAALEAA